MKSQHQISESWTDKARTFIDKLISVDLTTYQLYGRSPV